MRKLLPVVVTLSLAIWLGGLASLLLAVTTLFRADRVAAIDLAPRLFNTFEPVLLAALALAIATTVAWRLLVSCSKPKKLLLALLLSAAGPAVISIAHVTPRIDQLRMEGRRDTSEFRKLHGFSNVLYLAQITLATSAAVILPAAIRSES
jgi:hypothetical protein